MRRLIPLLLLLVAGCQPIPHPFADEAALPRPTILKPPDSAGILVLPVTGAPAPANLDLAKAMAAALRDGDVPASTHAQNRGSYKLSGTATVQEQGGQSAITVDWELRNPDGISIGKQTAKTEEPSALWRKGGKPAVAALAQPAAPVIAKLIEGDAPLPQGASSPLIALRPITGAPGDGERTLSTAMSDALRRANLSLAATPEDKPSFILQGKVELSAAAAGKQQVRVSWALLGADGGQIGQVNQDNAVPAGSLDGPWGDVAYAVANAAAPGIAALVQKAEQSPS